MFEHEIDSDDDLEGYFLQPVNAYNIVDKIKEANTELSTIPHPESPSVTGIQRKVKFREVLEDYEPQENEELVLETDLEDHGNESEVQEPTESSISLIEEEETEVDVEQQPVPETTLEEVMSSEVSENEIEEICEDIENITIETGNSDTKSSSSTTDSEKSNSVKSVITLQPSLCSQSSEQSIDESSTYSKTSDDNLSVIAACYVEDIPKITIQKEERPKSASHTRSRSVGGGVKPKSKATQQRVSDMLKLRLNYKTCCEYKNAIEEQLPKYNGYYSQYGLSREQWDMREKRIQNGRRRYAEKNSKSKEDETKKDNDNELAFTSWLRNKMRFPVNKTKNMFDFKPSKSKGKNK